MRALRFEDLRIDLDDASVTHAGEPVALTPKAFDVLAYLAQHAGTLVTKNELLDAVWQRRYISEGVIKNAIQELRSALGDAPKSPRYIETVHRRGYRFIANATAGTVPAPEAPQLDEAAHIPLLVGRDSELSALLRWQAQSAADKTVIVFVSGEPGIGKTTLIQAFIRQVERTVLCISGQCIEQYGQGEPYLPLLDAISQLARDGDEECLSLLRRTAPSWLAQLPWLVDTQEQTSLRKETQGATRERMLRELGEFMREWTGSHPLVLTLEDLHWSDHATLDAINYLARRKGGAHLLLLGSYRPADVAMSGHPFATTRGELMLHGLCHELALHALSEAEVGDYLQQRFPGDPLPVTALKAVFERTEGLPLFMARVADEFERDDRDFGQLLQRLPEGLKHLIDLQVDRLGADERQWLEIAAVCGDGFSPQILSAVSGTVLDRIEQWSEQQAQSHHLLRHAEATTLSARFGTGYSFIHAYYQERLYSRITPTRRADLHRSIGEHLEAQTATSSVPPAAELAVHFERGLEYARAATWRLQAAQNALARHAPHEAVTLLENGLSLLDAHLPATPDYQRLRLQYLTLLTPPLIATRGYAIPELEAHYARAMTLAESLGDGQTIFFALYGKWVLHLVRGELDVALQLSVLLTDMSERDGHPMMKMSACSAQGATTMFRGDYKQADDWFEQGVAIANALGTAGDQLANAIGQDPLVSMLSMQAITAQLRGHPDRAARLMHTAHERALTLGHPYTLSYLLFSMIWMYRDGGYPQQVLDWVPELESVSISHGFPVMANTAHFFRGWARVTLHHDEAGLEEMQKSLALLGTSGTRLTKTLYYYQLADACFTLRHYAESLHANALALDEAEACEERRYESSIWRQRAELLHILGDRNDETPASCLGNALSVARKQDACLLELRAACSQYKLVSPAKKDQTAQNLREIYSRFTEGFDTPFLQEAQTLLQLTASPAMD